MCRVALHPCLLGCLCPTSHTLFILTTPARGGMSPARAACSHEALLQCRECPILHPLMGPLRCPLGAPPSPHPPPALCAPAVSAPIHTTPASSSAAARLAVFQLFSSTVPGWPAGRYVRGRALLYAWSPTAATPWHHATSSHQSRSPSNLNPTALNVASHNAVQCKVEWEAARAKKGVGGEGRGENLGEGATANMRSAALGRRPIGADAPAAARSALHELSSASAGTKCGVNEEGGAGRPAAAQHAATGHLVI